MFGLFRRNKMLNPVALPPHSMILMSACQSIKPMKRIEFEMADQSLEDVFEWLTEQDHNQWCNGGHYSLSDQMIAHYQLNLSRYLDSSNLPVVFSNCTETLLHALPLLHAKRKELGIVHVGNQFEIKPTLEPEAGSVYHFSLARFNECRLFCMGIDATSQTEKTFEYAEDLGLNWLTLSECQFGHRLHVKQQLANYLSHCDEIVLNIDLASLCPKSRLESEHYLEVQMVTRIIRQCLLSEKVKLVQLVGWKDKHIFAKSTLSVLQELVSLIPHNDKVA
ncbi:arginase [Vibrio renipiscarius]|uniref:Arginase n=1 Tax=Vibrio renipiscarius TaxID=1461322 RepID=A0A0C2JEU3_9VIBR|nr:arginase [Vibrio renipiscarius]KII76439.1 arginase [Vibrio renipiscarius]KII78039.1 arginase [Vibrio renipiscarius]